MDLLASESSRLRFEAYIKDLASVIGHADRVTPLHDYCTGLLLPGDRKSVEPMAALTAPARTAPKHQSLLHFVAQGPGPIRPRSGLMQRQAVSAIRPRRKSTPACLTKASFIVRSEPCTGSLTKTARSVSAASSCAIRFIKSRNF